MDYCRAWGSGPVLCSHHSLQKITNPLRLSAAGACTAAGSPINGCFMNPAKGYAFLEFRSVEEASNAMVFDGVVCCREALKVRRPNDYSLQHAKTLGPTEPAAHLSAALLGKACLVCCFYFLEWKLSARCMPKQSTHVPDHSRGVHNGARAVGVPGFAFWRECHPPPGSPCDAANTTDMLSAQVLSTRWSLTAPTRCSWAGFRCS